MGLALLGRPDKAIHLHSPSLASPGGPEIIVCCQGDFPAGLGGSCHLPGALWEPTAAQTVCFHRERLQRFPVKVIHRIETVHILKSIDKTSKLKATAGGGVASQPSRCPPTQTDLLSPLPRPCKGLAPGRRDVGYSRSPAFLTTFPDSLCRLLFLQPLSFPQSSIFCPPVLILHTLLGQVRPFSDLQPPLTHSRPRAPQPSL